MPLRRTYRFRLTEISNEGKTLLSPTLQLDLVKHEDTHYIHFQLSPKEKLPPATEDNSQLLDFVKLITKQEYVSLTFNTILYDSFQLRLFFQPLMLPNLIYEFEFLDSSVLFASLIEELSDCEKMLDGFLTLKDINATNTSLHDFQKENTNCLSDSFETSMIEG